MTGTVYLGASEYSVREGEAFVTITVQRAGDTSKAVKVKYATDKGTATQGVDYTDNDGTAVIAAGADSVTIKVAIKDDALAEATETFSFSIIDIDSGTLLFPRTANISILDDEKPIVAPAQPSLTSPYTVTTTDVVTGLKQPMTVEWIPGKGSTALLAEKAGTIKVVDMATGATKSVLLDLRADVNSNGDRGLMDIALHPDFANKPYLYAFYVVDPAGSATATGSAGRDGDGNRYAHVVRYEIDTSGATPKVVAGSKTVLIGGAGKSLADISGNGALNFTDYAYKDLRASNVDPVTGLYKQDYIKVDSKSHAGGALAFGPDGALYISTGDGTSYGYADPRTAGVQDVDSLSGKILRVDPLTGKGFADNPFADGDLSSNQSKVWQLGLRNPYSMTFADDGRLIISETGWYSHEEINTGEAGANFGWPFFEGDTGGSLVKTPGYQAHADASSFYSKVLSGAIEITAAYHSFSHVNSDPGYQVSAIVGAGDIYTGNKYPVAFLNDYFFTDIVDGEIYSIDINDRTKVQFVTDIGAYGPVSFFQGPDGYLYFSDIANGRIARLNIVDPNAKEKLYLDTNKNQTITGTTTNDVFVINAPSSGYKIGPTDDGTGFVVGNNAGFDILFEFETIRFSDKSLQLPSLNGPVYYDDPDIVQNLVGKTANDVFVISGLSSAYAWGPTADGTGVVIWTVSKTGDSYDILTGFETIKFSDISVGIYSGVTIDGTRKSDRIDANHAPKGQPKATNDDDMITGKKGNDKIKALGGDDTILGGPGNDRIKGGGGDDLISGGKGWNNLRGGDGADSFRFDSKLGKSVGKVKDFDSAEGDVIVLDSRVFKKLAPGDLTDAAFAKHFDYAKGELTYKGDLVAEFSGRPELHADDFLVI